MRLKARQLNLAIFKTTHDSPIYLLLHYNIAMSTFQVHCKNLVNKLHMLLSPQSAQSVNGSLDLLWSLALDAFLSTQPFWFQTRVSRVLRVREGRNRVSSGAAFVAPLLAACKDNSERPRR